MPLTPIMSDKCSRGDHGLCILTICECDCHASKARA